MNVVGLRQQEADLEIKIAPLEGEELPQSQSGADRTEGSEFEDKSRASQMNAGAKQENGLWLHFLHADTRSPDSAIHRLNEPESDQAIQASGFRHQFSGDDWRVRFISFLYNFRCTRSRIIYGDQALFIRPSLCAKLGGFPDQPILEDIAFCEKVITETTFMPCFLASLRMPETFYTWESGEALSMFSTLSFMSHFVCRSCHVHSSRTCATRFPSFMASAPVVLPQVLWHS